jgi:serine/threonine protein kinase
MEMPKVGTDFGGYRIQGTIGRGGMSVVYLAEHPRLSRTVALKIIAPELAEDDVFRERFVRESRVAASLDHPNIIPIFDTGDQDGLLYIVMRYIKNDLRAIIRQEGQLSPHRTMAVASQVGGALDAAHKQGLVHRDVKPANILVAIRGGADGEDHSYLTDFGLTKHLTSRSGLTGSGQFVGTVDYMSPEQIEGKQADGRADVYALGCVVFQTLTGQVPFDKEADAAVIWAHLKEAPPRPSAFRRNLPQGIDDVVARAMAKDPEERFATCRDFIHAARQELEARSGTGEAPVGLTGETILRGGIPGAPPMPDPAGTYPGAPGREAPSPAPTPSPWEQGPSEPQIPAAPPSTGASVAAGAPSMAPSPYEGGRQEPVPAAAEPSTAAPDSPRRSKQAHPGRRSTVAASALAVILVLAAGAYFMFGRDREGTPSGSNAGTPVAAGGHGGHGASGGFPDEVEQQFTLFHIPDHIQPYCHRVPEGERNLFNRDAFRALSCVPPGPLEEVRYYLMHDSFALRSFFKQQVELFAPQAGEPDCGFDQSRKVHWGTDRDDGSHAITSVSQRYNGFVLCYQRPDGIWTMEWTDGGTKIYTVATSAEQDPQPLVDLWTEELGPAHPEHADDIYVCSGASHDLPSEGQLVGSVLQVNESEGCMLFSDGEHLYEIDITESTESKFDSFEALMAHLTEHQQAGTATAVEVQAGPEDQVLAASISDA